MLQKIPIWLLLFFFATPLLAQTPAPMDSTITLSQALDLAERNFPQLQAQKQRVNSAQYKVGLARTDALPQLDAHLQGNYGTANNINGLFYPQLSIPPISGPVSQSNNYQGFFGSAAGMVLFWEPITFGKRKAKIDQAKAGLDESQADFELALFTHQIRVVEAYLNHRLASELVKTQVSNLKRARILFQSVTVLAQNGLRPGVDTTLTKAEIARSTVAFNQAQENESVTAIQLSELLGRAGEKIKITGDNFMTQVPAESVPIPSNTSHPVLSLYQSKIRGIQFEEAAIRRSYAPKLSFLANGFARGSGASLPGANQDDHSINGLSFSKYNYSVGAQLNFPIMKFSSVRYQSRIAQQDLKAQELLLNDQQLMLENNRQIARRRLQTAYQNIQQTALQVLASQQAYKQIQARYESGLTTLPEVYQALWAVNQAEADQARAITAIWQAHLYQAYCAGDLNDFLTLMK